MASQSLYRKWRSQSFDDIIGQPHVVRTLRNAVSRDRIAHAYLFTGPRGTGKTSMARILAKAVNCLEPVEGGPCGHCSNCVAITEGRAPDVIEIDGASNNGIEDIRTLRERVAYAPVEARFKVYIIDEVHRLTGQAFDALLKTLEEPPQHVIFMFASTEPHKVPATILSRCQQFEFRRIDGPAVIGRLAEVSGHEGLSVDDGALRLIAQQSGGSLRDALGILDQVHAYSGETITAGDVREGIGLGAPEIIGGLTEAILAPDPGRALGVIAEAVNGGVDPRMLTRQLIDYWRALLLQVNGAGDDADVDPALKDLMPVHGAALTPAQAVDVLRALTEQVVEPRLNVAPQLPLELGVVQAILLLHDSPASQPPQQGTRANSPQERGAIREDQAPAPRTAGADRPSAHGASPTSTETRAQPETADVVPSAAPMSSGAPWLDSAVGSEPPIDSYAMASGEETTAVPRAGTISAEVLDSDGMASAEESTSVPRAGATSTEVLDSYGVASVEESTSGPRAGTISAEVLDSYGVASAAESTSAPQAGTTLTEAMDSYGGDSAPETTSALQTGTTLAEAEDSYRAARAPETLFADSSDPMPSDDLGDDRGAGSPADDSAEDLEAGLAARVELDRGSAPAFRLDETPWPAVIEGMRTKNQRLQAVLRSARVISWSDEEVVIDFRHRYHYDECEKSGNRALVREVIIETTGTSPSLRYTMGASRPVGETVDDTDVFIREAEHMLRGVHAREMRDAAKGKSFD